MKTICALFPKIGMKYLIPLLAVITGYAAVPGSVYLINDSPYVLIVQVKSADGNILGHATIQPGEQKNSVTDLNSTGLNLPNDPSGSATPYSVVWKCPNGGFYSVCTGQSPGSLVRATTCPGSYYCRPKEKKEDKCCRPCKPGEKSK
jgi:hypothetical protein